MGRIGLVTLIPEGTHIFKIVAVDHKVDFGKIEVKLKAENGQTHTEKYTLDSDGGIKAFSFMAKTALNDYSLKEIEANDLVGHFFEADVEHENVESKNDPSKMVTFVKLTNKRPSTGFIETATAPKTTATAQTAAPTTPRKKTSLADLLGG